MSNDILRITTLSGKPVIIDATGKDIKVSIQDEGKAHQFLLVAVRHDERGHYLDVGAGNVVIISGEDAVQVTALVNSRPKKADNKWMFIAGGVAAVLVLILIGTSGSGGSEQSKQTATADQPAAQEKTVAGLGDAITNERVAMVVTDVLLRDKVGGEYFAESAADGGVLVIVETTIKNIGDKPLKSYELPNVTLVDDKGNKYNPDLGKTGAYATETDLNTKLMSDLNPDIAVRDAQVFEVSKTRFNRDTWYVLTEDGEKISIASRP